MGQKINTTNIRPHTKYDTDISPFAAFYCSWKNLYVNLVRIHSMLVVENEQTAGPPIGQRSHVAKHHLTMTVISRYDEY